jgi:hypothetical protein
VTISIIFSLIVTVSCTVIVTVSFPFALLSGTTVIPDPAVVSAAAFGTVMMTTVVITPCSVVVGSAEDVLRATATVGIVTEKLSGRPRIFSDEAMSAHPTYTPSALSMGRAKHAVPVAHMAREKRPLSHVPVLPLMQATEFLEQGDDSFSDINTLLYCCAVARFFANVASLMLLVAGKVVIAVGRLATGVVLENEEVVETILDEVVAFFGVVDVVVVFDENKFDGITIVTTV